jgi:hypothetical protein
LTAPHVAPERRRGLGSIRSRLAAVRYAVSRTRLGWWLWRARHAFSRTRLGWWLWRCRTGLPRRLRAITLPPLGHLVACVVCPRTGGVRVGLTWRLCRSMWAGGELAAFTSGNLPISVSDPKVIRWHTTSFSYVGDLIDLDFFGLRRRRFRDIVPILLLLYVSSLKLLGYVPEATSIYRSMTRRPGRVGAYGWIGLADITHTVALWRRLVDEYDARGFTLFPLAGGLTAFLSESMGWTLAVEATFDEARRCYTAAIDAAPDLAFAWHELARLEADAGNHAAAAEAMTEFARRIAGAVGADSQTAGELEAARLRALAVVPDLDADDAVSMVSRRDAVGAGGTAPLASELPVSFHAYWRGREHVIEKKLAFETIGSHLLQEGFVSAYSGAPYVTSLDKSFDSSTTYPSYPGREIFSPLFLGSASEYELYVARTTATIRNAVVLPGFADNYFHFLFDTVGALALIEPTVLDGRELVLFSHGLKPFHRDVFELLGIGRDRLRTQRPGRYAVSAENVVVVDYPTPLTVVHPRTVPFLRDALLGRQQEPTPGKRIYLERTGARSFARRTRQELRELFSRYGFVVAHPEKLTVREQIQLVRDAEAVAVDAGAGAANLLFAARRAKVFILAPLVVYTEAFTPLCALGDLDLYVALSDARIHPKYLFTWSEAQPEADLETLELCLERAFLESGTRASVTPRTASRNSSYERK